MKYIDVSLKKLRKISLEEAQIIKNQENVDLLIYVARAGLPIAVYMNEVFKKPLLGIGAQRKGNGLKSKLGPLFAHIPSFVRNILITIEMKSKVHKKDVERHVSFHPSLKDIDISQCKTILICEDSIDTGHSMKAVYQEVKRVFPKAKILTYALNVWKQSEELFLSDYHTYEDTVIRAPMSKDSKEYRAFLAMYDKETQNEYL